MKQLLYLITLFVTLFLYSCDLFNLNQEPTLPELTQEGAGSFGCLIDGELFLPSGPDPAGGMRGNPNATLTEVSGTLIIQSQVEDEWRINLKSFIDLQNGIYNFEDTTILTDLSSNTCQKFIVDSNFSSIEIIFIEIENDIISGTFSGIFINECDSTQIIQISEGRFDLNYTL